MNSTNRFFLFLFSFSSLTLFAQKAETVAPKTEAQKREEYLQSLPQKVRDSIVFMEWKKSVAEREKINEENNNKKFEFENETLFVENKNENNKENKIKQLMKIDEFELIKYFNVSEV